MAFCANCGTQIQDGVKFCPSCGNPAGAAAQQTQPRQDYYTPPAVPGAPGQADIHDVQENKAMAVIAYILFFIPLLTGAHNTSPFVRYHTNQGTALFVAAVVYGIAYGILSAVLIFIPVVGWIMIALLGLAALAFPVLCIIGIVSAVNGRIKPLPLIGGITILK